MNKYLLCLALIPSSCLASKAQSAAHARTQMQHIWQSNTALTREYLVSSILDIPAAKLVAQQLLENQKELGQLFSALYGKEKAQEVTTLLTKQAELTLALIDANTKKDAKAIAKVQSEWKSNACALSSFLDKTNPYLQYKELHALFLEYLTTLNKMITDRLEKKWGDDLVDYDALRAQMHKIVSIVGKALTNAFPKPVVKQKPPKPRVTVPLPPGTSLRKAV